MEPEQNTVRDLLGQASQMIAGSADAAVEWLSRAETTYDVASKVSWGLLLLGFALLIVYEMGQSDRGPRVGHILLKLGIVVALLLEYGRVVSLITGIAGGGDWGQWDEVMSWAENIDSVVSDKYDGIGSLPQFLFWLLMIGILLLASLFAFVISQAISLSQGVLISIALCLGKLAITASIVPGVSLGKSWARFLAMVAAWTTVGGAILSLMQVQSGQVFTAIGTYSELAVLKLSGRYVVLGAALGATPWITAALFNGVAAMAPGLPNIATSGWAMARASGALGRSSAPIAKSAARSSYAAVRRMSPGGNGGGSGEPTSRAGLWRLHKVPPAKAGQVPPASASPNSKPKAERNQANRAADTIPAAQHSLGNERLSRAEMGRSNRGVQYAKPADAGPDASRVSKSNGVGKRIPVERTGGARPKDPEPGSARSSTTQSEQTTSQAAIGSVTSSATVDLRATVTESRSAQANSDRSDPDSGGPSPFAERAGPTPASSPINSPHNGQRDSTVAARQPQSAATPPTSARAQGNGPTPAASTPTASPTKSTHPARVTSQSSTTNEAKPRTKKKPHRTSPPRIHKTKES